MTLLEYRKLKGLSRAKMAALIGCDATTVWRYETGRQKPSASASSAILAATQGAVSMKPADSYLAPYRGQEMTAELARKLFSYDPSTGVLMRNTERARKATRKPTAGRYVQINILGKSYYAHRLAWLIHYGEWPAGDIDHINRDKGDNRIANLRDVSRKENCNNRQKPNQDSRPITYIGGKKYFITLTPAE